MKTLKKVILSSFLVLSFNQTLLGNENDIIELKKEILSRYSENNTNQEIFQYLNMNEKFTEPGYLVNANNEKVYIPFNNILNEEFSKRFKYYLFNHYVQKFLQYDYDMYSEILENRNNTNERIREKSQKILDISTGIIGITNTIKTGIKDVNHLNYINAGVSRGASTDLYISQTKYLIENKINSKITSKVEDKIKSLFSSGPMGRIMNQCIFVTDMSGLVGCGLETGGQLILNIGDLYTSTKDLSDIRRRGSTVVAETYLYIYYLLGEHGNSINNFLKLNFNLQESEFDNLKEKLDAIAQYKWNKNYEIGGEVEYDFNTAKEYINKYQQLINTMTTDFTESFSVLILQDGDMGIRFDDIKQNSYVFDKLQVAKAYGIDIKGYIIDGKNYFKPNQNITNAEALALMSKGVTRGYYQGIATQDWINRTDIKKYFDWFNSGHTPYANLSGINETNLYENMTRKQMAKLLYLWLKDYDNNFFNEELINNNEVTEDWIYEALVLKKMNIVNGKPNGEFEPINNITRGEFLIMLINSLNHITCANKNCQISTILEDL